MRLDRFGDKIDKSKIEILDSIEFDEKHIAKLKDYIKRYIDNDYPLEILRDQWEDITTKIKPRDGSSLESFVIKYGKEIGTKLFEDKTSRSTVTREDWVQKYGEEKANELLSLRGASLENFIARHGEKLGQEKWDDYISKRKKVFAQGRKEGRYESRDLKWFQEKYGDEKGYKIWDNKRKSRSWKISRKYLESIHGKEKTDEILKKRHTRDLKFFIKKYGEKEGERRYRSKIYRATKNRPGKRYSKWAIAVCNEIKTVINDLKYYGEDELILQLTSPQIKKYGQKIIMPDLFYRGKIIEFNGDLFHGNPKLFEDTDTPHPYDRTKTAKEMQEADARRYEYYKMKDYKLLVIWENDYNQNKEKVINECLEFLK